MEHGKSTARKYWTHGDDTYDTILASRERNAEIRQNTQSLEINAYQNLIEQIRQVGTLAAEVPEQFGNSYRLLDSTPEELSEDEQLRAAAFAMNFVRHGDLAYKRLSDIDSVTLRPKMSYIQRSVFESPGLTIRGGLVSNRLATFRRRVSSSDSS